MATPSTDPSLRRHSSIYTRAQYVSQGWLHRRAVDAPFESLNVGLPKAKLVVWPQEVVTAMVELADELGRPSLGDAILTMSWLGVRRQDWLAWPTNIFDTPYLAWSTEKTNAPVTIRWSVIPELKVRIEAAEVRHQRATLRATTFFVDDLVGRTWSTNRCHHAFDTLRSALAEKMRVPPFDMPSSTIQRIRSGYRRPG